MTCFPVPFFVQQGGLKKVLLIKTQVHPAGEYWIALFIYIILFAHRNESIPILHYFPCFDTFTD